MNSNIILVVLGEPNSTFSEILFKYLISSNFKKNKKKLILIGSKKLLKEQMKVLKYNISINEVLDIKKATKKFVNIINVEYKFRKPFSKITTGSSQYIEKCFNLALKLIKKKQY